MRIISRRMVIVSIAAGLASLAVANDSWAERDRSLAGTWMLTSNVNTREDGTKADIFGSNPKGVLILSPDGYFAVVNTRADLPKFASNNRMKGTAEENKAIVQGSIALYGRYSVDPKNNLLTLKVESSTWPSWTGTEQKRKYTLKGDELRWTLAASVGGTAEVAWKRVK